MLSRRLHRLQFSRHYDLVWVVVHARFCHRCESGLLFHRGFGAEGHWGVVVSGELRRSLHDWGGLGGGWNWGELFGGVAATGGPGAAPCGRRWPCHLPGGSIALERGGFGGLWWAFLDGRPVAVSCSRRSLGFREVNIGVVVAQQGRGEVNLILRIVDTGLSYGDERCGVLFTGFVRWLDLTTITTARRCSNTANKVAILIEIAATTTTTYGKYKAMM